MHQLEDNEQLCSTIKSQNTKKLLQIYELVFMIKNQNNDRIWMQIQNALFEFAVTDNISFP